MRVARRLVIGGRVQGVGFRWFAYEAAMREGVTGWVRNLPDGRIETHVEGEADAVTRVERALRHGPPAARVEHVDVDIEEPIDAYREFSITLSHEDPTIAKTTLSEHVWFRNRRVVLVRACMDLKQHIRHVPDFPKSGILFYDITTLLRDPRGFKVTVDMLSTPYMGRGVDVVVGIESRGFILGAAVAERIGAGFIPIRKPGKLPAKAITETYDLEYGTDALEIHADAVDHGQRVLIVDDVLATGGTAAAAAQLVKKLGGELMGLGFLIELLFLNGKAKLPGEKVFSVLQY